MDDIVLFIDYMEEKLTGSEERTNIDQMIHDSIEDKRNRSLGSPTEREPSQIIEATPPSSFNSVFSSISRQRPLDSDN